MCSTLTTAPVGVSVTKSPPQWRQLRLAEICK
jgi:hypothetical protein